MTSPAQGIALRRGALVTTASDQTRRSISFQYNPDSVRRTLEPNVVGGQPGARARAVRFAGAPTETFTLDCRFSSVDTAGATGGVAPQLAALALLVYPTTAEVTAAQALLDQGQIEVVPALADRLLFVFGQVVVPVQLVSFSIVEELHDSELTPVLATVTLSLRTTSYSDVDSTNPSYQEFMTYQSRLEQIAAPAYRPGGPS